MLRTQPLGSWHFRRQVQIGPYYADFASHAAKLVIEVDGWTHGTDVEQARDASRSARMREHGYRTVRFTNTDVMNRLDGVFTAVMDLLESAPTRPGVAGPPSPEGRENQRRDKLSADKGSET